MIGWIAVLAVSTAVGVDAPGLLRVPYDAAKPPALSCSVRAGCELVLQPGERLTFASTSYGRWSAVTADDGDSGLAPRLLLRPPSLDEPDGHGGRRLLRTWLTILTTRREYVVVLASSSRDQETRLGFTYRDTPRPLLGASPAPVPTATSASAPSAATLAPRTVDPDWSVTGDPAVRCAQPPFSVGNQVWCQLPSSAGAMPAAFAVDGSRLLPIPFHVTNGKYLVVDAMISPIALVVGGTRPRVAIITRVRK